MSQIGWTKDDDFSRQRSTIRETHRNDVSEMLPNQVVCINAMRKARRDAWAELTYDISDDSTARAARYRRIFKSVKKYNFVTFFSQLPWVGTCHAIDLLANADAASIFIELNLLYARLKKDEHFACTKRTASIAALKAHAHDFVWSCSRARTKCSCFFFLSIGW